MKLIPTIKKSYQTYLFTLLFTFMTFNLHAQTNTDISPQNQSDTVITTSIQNKIAKDPVTKSSNMTINTENGVVTINGTARSETQAAKIIEIAESVNNVVDVDTSSLKVEGSVQPVEDSYITAKVKGMLLRKSLEKGSRFSATKIKVETQNGVVYLSGPLKNKKQQTLVVDAAKSIHGVSKVVPNFS